MVNSNINVKISAIDNASASVSAVWQKARILGSKAKADEAMKTGDIRAIFNAMKPERYKVKSINEVARNSAITSGLNQGNEVNIQKAFTNEQIKNIMNELINIKGVEEPNKITIDYFLKNAPFNNAQNIIKHLSSRKDSKNRIEHLSYAIPTFLQSDKKIKVYELDETKNIFVFKWKFIKKIGNNYSLISTNEAQTIVYTFIDNYKIKKFKKELENAVNP